MQHRNAWVAAACLLFLLLAVLTGSITLASDPPDSKVNPQSGYIQTVDSVWEDSDYDVRHVTDPGQGQPQAVGPLSDGAPDDVGPRIEIAASGDTWVVWWRDAATDQVLVRELTYSTLSWSSERLVSSSGESSRHPEIVHDGSDAWVAYELDDAGGTSVAVYAIVDDPAPFGRTVLATTSYGADVNVLIHYESVHLWVTWVDSAADVGWSEYDYSAGSWNSPAYDSYASDDVETARGRIRATVLGQ